MSNQVGDCFKFLWPFQDVQTLSREEKEKKRKVRVVYKSIIIRVCTCPMWSNFPRDFGILFQWHMVLRYSLNLEFRVLSIHSSASWFLHMYPLIFSILTSDILRRLQKFEKDPSHFVMVLCANYPISKSSGIFFFKLYYGLLSISELRFDKKSVGIL